MIRTNTQKAVANWIVVTLLVITILLAATVAYLWTKQSATAPVATGAPTPSAPTNNVPPKPIEVVFTKEEKLALQNSGVDGADVIAWRDLIDSQVCSQLNPFQIRHLASQLTSKQLILRVETTAALLALLETCQPGASKYQAPPTVYLSQEDKAELLKDGFGEATKTMAGLAGGLDLETCVIFSGRDIDQLIEYIRLGKLELSERSRQQLPVLLEHCRK